MKKAVLYARVSTDEQADKGYSLDDQQEKLIKYCNDWGIEILKIYVEDHSAKNFNRPEFQKFLNYAKANHRNIDFFFCFSWDRFSRNVTDAYEMIRRLHNFDIEIQAITQRLDWDVPESKIMLSVYLTLPEVDNENRSRNVRKGMRGANKSGRWVRYAPIGYINRRDELNKPIIVPIENAYLIENAFKEVAKNERSLNEIRKELYSNGVKVSRSNFSRMVRNPVYTGKIFIPAYKDEPEQIVKGLHEAIVSDELFEAVQIVVSGRNKKLNKCTSIKEHAELPLRGLLNCSNCGNHVTGSASKSRTGEYYYYYHCMNCKQERFRADKANNEMETLLNTLQINDETKALFETIKVADEIGNPKQQAQKLSTLTQELNKLNARKEELQNMLLDKHLTPQDYTELKKRLENKIMDVRAEISDLKDQNKDSKSETENKLNILTNLLETYRNSDIQQKRKLIVSIFPEKFTFVKNQVGNIKLDEGVALILNKIGAFTKKEAGQNRYFSILSRLVKPTATIVETLTKVARGLIFFICTILFVPRIIILNNFIIDNNLFIVNYFVQ